MSTFNNTGTPAEQAQVDAETHRLTNSKPGPAPLNTRSETKEQRIAELRKRIASLPESSTVRAILIHTLQDLEQQS